MSISQPQLPRTYTLRARWLLPGAGPAAENAAVTIHDGRIASLRNDDATEPAYDLGDAILLPGLVNAHTHLEFSDLASPLGQPGISLPAWIRLLVQLRRQRGGGPGEAIAAGIRESLASGVTALGEIATGDWVSPTTEPSPHLTAYFESIALSAERAEACLAATRGFLESRRDSAVHGAGISPHAPYTVRPDLLAALVAQAREHTVPVAMHVAETREEIELLRDGGGPLVELLEELGAWRPGVIPLGARPLDYLRAISEAPRALVIHGNYLDDEELNFLAAQRARMSLVYCPRTHDYFRHAPYHNLARLIERGINVCVGTDSRASNPDLALLNELRFVAERATNLPGESILNLGTSNAARALGLELVRGTIHVGAGADLLVLRPPSRAARDPWELAWDHSTQVDAVILAGKVVQGGPIPANRAT